MFKFLKKKFKEAVNNFTKKTEKEVIEKKIEDKKIIEEAIKEEKEEIKEEEYITEIKDTKEAIKYRKKQEIIKKEEIKNKEIKKSENIIEKKEKKKIKKDDEKLKEKIELLKNKENKLEDKKEKIKSKKEPKTENKDIKSEKNKVQEEEKKEPKFFTKLTETFTKKQLSEKKFEELFWDLEITLLENNVAIEVIEKIKNNLKKELTKGKISRGGVDKLIIHSLRKSIKELFIEPFDLIEKIKKEKKETKPYVIVFIGVNGSGKTTTLAKIANLFLENNLTVAVGASDTFRAAAIDQLKKHTDNLGIKLISQGYGADPAAVAYDSIEYGKAKKIDVIMIDTAGRLHSNTNLMAELKKVIKVSKPNLKIFIGESITGNDCIEQAKEFDRLIGIDAIILSKTDVDEKGGAAISVSYVTGKPIIYLGIGQTYGDLVKFDKEKIIKSIGL